MLSISTQIQLELASATPMIFRLLPRQQEGQRIDELNSDFGGAEHLIAFQDVYGNNLIRAVMPKGTSTINILFKAVEGARPEVGRDYVPIESLPLEALAYLAPSRYCESDLFLSRTRAVLKGASPGTAQVEAVCQMIAEKYQYLPGTSQRAISADSVATRTEGVCRDFSHLAIAMLRSISIPARFVVGYLENLVPSDQHAWIEAFVGGDWQMFDPTPGINDGERICVARGRDAADVAIMDQFGPLPLKSAMLVSVESVVSREST